MSTIYLVAVAFGVTLLVASLLLGGKDTDHGDAHGEVGLAWAPVGSMRFWVFLLAFGGGAGLALEALGSTRIVSAAGAVGVGWIAGAMAVQIIGHITRHSVSSGVGGRELVGATGTLQLPASPTQPGKVRLDVKGRQEDFVALVVADGGALATGTEVLVIGEGERGSLLVAKV